MQLWNGLDTETESALHAQNLQLTVNLALGSESIALPISGRRAHSRGLGTCRYSNNLQFCEAMQNLYLQTGLKQILRSTLDGRKYYLVVDLKSTIELTETSIICYAA